MFRLLLLSALLWVSVASAAGLDTLRSSAKAARESSNQIRSEQMQKRQELNQVSARIEALKSQSKGKLLPGGELDVALKRSQELSGALSNLAQSASQQEQVLESANLSLLKALSDELSALRAEFDRQTDRGARSQTLARMKAVRAEREQVRAQIPASKVPALSALEPSVSDDPEELLEQADRIRDDEDKVRKELKALEARIAEAKAERELDAHVRQFLGDESLFDDQDRRLRVRKETFQPGTNSPQAAFEADTASKTAGQPNARGTEGATAGSPQGAGSNFNSNPSSDSFNAPGAPGSGAGGPPPGSGPNSTGSSPSTRVTSGSDARPLVGSGYARGGGDDDDLEELEVQRRKLSGLAEQLKSKAKELDQKASTLK